MKCPKCYFIGFDDGHRCKNCGYQFSLAVENESLELPLKTGEEPFGPLADFPIETTDPPLQRPARTASDLPLFGLRDETDDRPLVSLPASPRAPVSVRKSSPAVRPAAARKSHQPEPELVLEPEAGTAQPFATAIPREGLATPDALSRGTSAEAHASTAAPAGLRIGAALIDLALLLAIDATVLYFTLRICGLTIADWRIIPPAPFLAFVALLNGGYMAGATAASGQSVGKVVSGIKVVNADPDARTDRVSLGQSLLRTVGYVISAFPAGIGFLPALVGSERRALHDRLAHTRVVKS